jgi:hypothetical protein
VDDIVVADEKRSSDKFDSVDPAPPLSTDVFVSKDVGGSEKPNRSNATENPDGPVFHSRPLSKIGINRLYCSSYGKAEKILKYDGLSRRIRFSNTQKVGFDTRQ